MGNLCSTESGGTRSFSDILIDIFPGTTPVLPWRTDLQLLSVVVKTRRAPGYSLVGSLHDFVTADQQLELEKLQSKSNRESVEWVCQRIAQQVQCNYDNLAKLFLTEPHGQATGELAALIGSAGSVNLTIDEHGAKNVEAFNRTVLPRAVQLDMEFAKERLEWTGCWGFGQLELFVVDRIIMARNVELEFSKEKHLGGDATVAATAIPLQAGLKLTHDSTKVGSYYLQSTEIDPTDNRPVPFGIAFGCVRLRFDADGKRVKVRSSDGLRPAGESVDNSEPLLDYEPATLEVQEDGYAHLELLETATQALPTDADNSAGGN